MPTLLKKKAKQILDTAKEAGIRITAAESCTGGLIAAALTDIPGSSYVFERGFVTYSNESKVELLDVPEEILKSKGAVSRETALAMAEGALKHASAALSVAVTGIAGPDGGSEDKPVGLVYVASAFNGKGNICKEYTFSGDRDSVRAQTVEAAMDLILERIG